MINKKVKKRQMQKKNCLMPSKKETHCLTKRGEEEKNKDLGLLGAKIHFFNNERLNLIVWLRWSHRTEPVLGFRTHHPFSSQSHLHSVTQCTFLGRHCSMTVFLSALGMPQYFPQKSTGAINH